MLRLSALVIVLVTAIGLYKKAWLPEKHCIRAGFFVYYTHLSNLLILLYELALGASGHDPHCGAFRWLSSPGVALSMTLCIYVTHLIYAFVLLPTAHRRDDESWLKGRFSFGNVCVHFITPGLTVLIRIAEALEVATDWILRANTPGTYAVANEKISDLLEDCTCAEMQDFLRILEDVKKAVRRK